MTVIMEPQAMQGMILKRREGQRLSSTFNLTFCLGAIVKLRQRHPGLKQGVIVSLGGEKESSEFRTAKTARICGAGYQRGGNHKEDSAEKEPQNLHRHSPQACSGVPRSSHTGQASTRPRKKPAWELRAQQRIQRSQGRSDIVQARQRGETSISILRIQRRIQRVCWLGVSYPSSRDFALELWVEWK